MLNNKKSQLIVFKIMMAILLFIVALIFSTPTKEVIDDARNTTNLNCTSAVITPVQNATCIVLDMSIFYYLSILIATGLAFLTGKRTVTGVITTIFIFVAVVVMITPLKDLIVLFRSNLSCGAVGLSTGAQMACIFVDLWLFYFIVTAIASAITLIFVKKVLPPTFGEKK